MRLNAFADVRQNWKTVDANIYFLQYYLRESKISLQHPHTIDVYAEILLFIQKDCFDYTCVVY